MEKTKNLLKISAIYLGTILGAGFASGQELMQFFVRFSSRGILGCILAGVLFSLLGGIVVGSAYELSVKTHRNYLKTVFGSMVARWLAIITELFLCVSFCVMLSGVGAFFRERLSLPAWLGILLTDAICLIVFLHDVRGLSAINLVLTPIMLLGTIFISVYSIFSGTQPVWMPQINTHGKFLPYALFYVGYNMLTATAVLVPASALATDKKSAKAGGILGGIFLSVMAILCTVALYLSEYVWETSLPMLFLAQRAGSGAFFLYSLVLYMAMLTTAVSTGFSVTERLQESGVGRLASAVLVCLLALPFSFVEFSVWVRYSYLFFGIPGLLLVGGILWKWYNGSLS